MIDDIKDLKKFPAVVSGIYFLYKFGKLVYVGRSENVFQRIGTHVHGNKDFDSFSFIEIRAGDLEKTECDFIDFFNPPLNVGKPVIRVSDEQFDRVSDWNAIINKSDYSHSQIAEIAGVPQPMFSLYIRVKLRPRVDHFEAIEDALKSLGL